MRQLPDALAPLAAYNQFMLYKLVWNGAKYDKIPLSVTTLKAVSPHDPANQVDVNTALEKANQLGDLYGVAFVFTERDPFWFLDIDHCLINGEWSPLAVDLMNRLNGCAIEVGSSNESLHLFGTGVIGAHGCRNKEYDLEFYHTGRFVALTGTHATGDASTDHTQALRSIIQQYFYKDPATTSAEWTNQPREDWDGPTDDQELIAKAMSSSSTAAKFGNKATFADLWNKNVTALADFYPDEEPKEFGYSEAEAALAQHLAFWTGCDCQRILNLMWQSGLKRDKWEDHKTYLQMTILNAVAKQQDVYKQNRTVQVVNPEEDLNPLIARIETEGADYNKARKLIAEISEQELPVVDKELLASKLFDTMKVAGIEGVKKSTIVNACLGKQATQHKTVQIVPYIDLKANGQPKATKENLRALLDFIGATCRYNLMSKEVEINVPNTTYTTDNALNCALNDVVSAAARYDLSKSGVEDNILNIADENCYNPAKSWIDSQVWDGVDRIQPLVESLDASNPELAYKFVRRWLISAVAAVYQPQGVNAQGMIVLQGEQYLGKSRWFWSLLPYREWGKESAILNPHDKDSVKQSVSRWIVELGELDGTFKKSDIEALKGFITRGEDELRLPYGRLTNKYPRRTVFFGTVNPAQYLHDDTGNRRFWTISCGDKLNADHGIDVGQLWAQMKVHYDHGEQWWLTHEENEALNEHNREFEARDPVEELISVHYNPEDKRTRQLTATEVLQEIGFDKPTSLQTRQAGAAIRKIFKVKARKSQGRLVYDMPLRLSPAFKS